jgi:hypothetical protein
MTWPLWLGLLTAVLVLAAVGVSVYGSKRWTDTARALRRKVSAARTDGKSLTSFPVGFDARELEELPAPVQRYFVAVMKEGQPVVTALTIEMAGTFNMSTTAERWKPFTSRQRVATHRPGFLWDAQVSIMPGLMVRVIDSYIAGAGLLHAAILGLFTVAQTSGGGEVARGEFMRFLAEAAWYPTALLPSQGVRWEAVDERSAHATIADGPLTLTLLFRFNQVGLIDSVHADARGAIVGDKVVMMPWECNLSNYEVRNGMTVPMTGEASWVRPEGRRPYFRGTVTSLTYEFAPS